MKKLLYALTVALLMSSLFSFSPAYASFAEDIGDQYTANGNYRRTITCSRNNRSDFDRGLVKGCFLILFLGMSLLMVYQFTKGYRFRGYVSLILVIIISFFFLQFYNNAGVVKRRKPVIYFYSPKEQVVDVHLYYAGELSVTYPKYDNNENGWKIKVFPGGRIVDLSDQKEYSYIFWEGDDSGMQYDFSEGFVVPGENVDAFLEVTLSKMGLIPREYNEFIVYWYPILKKNKYNLIYFAHEEYEKIAPLEIIPKPDSLLRVFMVSKPLTKMIAIKAQEIKPFIRTGFTVVEWGGTELDE